MTKEEMIEWLEKIIKRYKDNKSDHIEVIAAADLLASLRGWKTQSCSRQTDNRRPRPSDGCKVIRDSRLDKIKK